MQMKYEFEQNIKKALEIECQDVAASQTLKEKIDEEIWNNQKEAEAMKHLSVKKLIIGVAAVCLLVGGGTYAAGHASYLVSHSYLGDAYTGYDEMDAAQKELGYEVDTVETFSNGYSFTNMSVDDVTGKDDDGNAVYSYKEMMINYDKAGSSSIYLSICRPVEAYVGEKTPDATAECGDITLYYNEYTYKFVPPDYELTEEDKANEEKDNYYISYGSSEVQIKKSQGVTWEKDGVSYNLAGFELNLSAEEMFDMAEQVIQ